LAYLDAIKRPRHKVAREENFCISKMLISIDAGEIWSSHLDVTRNQQAVVEKGS
jgi:hypothetical protein